MIIIKNILIPILLLPVLFSACKDDPVTPTEDFAPARFNWRTMDINGHGFAGIWAMDTNRIFLLNHYDKSLYIESNGNVTTHYVGEYYLNEIKGLSENEVYLFGTQIGGNMTIIKWNGGGFEYYPTSIYVTGNNIYWVRGCAVSSNEVWILSQNGISKYNSENMTNYFYDDSLLIPQDLFMSYDNKIQYIAQRWIDTAHIQQSLFEFRDTCFVRIYNEIILPYPSREGTYLQEISGYKFGLEFNEPLGTTWTICIKYFTGSSFTKYFCLNNKINSTWISQSQSLVGINLQNFILLVNTAANVFDSSRVGIIHWNGSKVSKEISLHGYESPYPYDKYILHAVNHSNYLVLEPYILNGIWNNTLFIGTKKL